MNPVKYKRVDQFRSGPQNFTFHLCEKHKDDVDSCFYSTADHPLEPVSEDEAEGEECHSCRGEEGP